MITTLADNIRRAAHGKHVCQLCRRRIDRGEQYRDRRLADYGTVWTWREHLRCGRFAERVIDRWDRDDGIDCVIFAEYVMEFPDEARNLDVPIAPEGSTS